MGSFFRWSSTVKGASAFIVGMPYDGGATWRHGQHTAPSAIRRSTNLMTRGHIWSDAHQVWIGEGDWIVDIGNLTLPRHHKDVMNRIHAEMMRLTNTGARPLALGGDHSVTIAILSALYERLGQPLYVVHFDAHPDTSGGEPSHGTWLREAFEQSYVCGAVQYGIRGHYYGPEEQEFAAKNGIKVVDSLDSIHHLIPQDAPIYLSVDIDVVDPAFAPGTGTPEPGGLTSAEFLEAVRHISGSYDIAGADIVEVCPAYDHSDITSILASRAVIEIAGGWQLRYNDGALSKLKHTYRRGA